MKSIYGKFNISWTGGGTNDTRLSNWLGGSGAPVTTSTVRVPYVQGADLLCTSNSTYTIQNSIAGSSVTWSVSPTSLFATPTSGTGTSATIRAASSSVSGLGTLTFAITISGCTAFNITKSIWVGKPATPSDMIMDLYFSSPPFTVCGNTTEGFIALDNTNFASSTTYNWLAPTGGSILGGQGTNSASISMPAGPASDFISVRAENTCGVSSYFNASVTINDCGFRISDPTQPSIRVFPNPVKDVLNLKVLVDEFNTIDKEDVTSEVRLFDKFGRLVLRRAATYNDDTINVANLQSDIYLLEVTIDDKKYFQKIMITK